MLPTHVRVMTRLWLVACANIILVCQTLIFSHTIDKFFGKYSLHILLNDNCQYEGEVLLLLILVRAVIFQVSVYISEVDMASY